MVKAGKVLGCCKLSQLQNRATITYITGGICPNTIRRNSNLIVFNLLNQRVKFCQGKANKIMSIIQL